DDVQVALQEEVAAVDQVAEVVRGDDVVAVGQQRDEVAEHERAGRVAVQQDDRGRVGGAGLPVEDLVAVDCGGPVVYGVHGSPLWCRERFTFPGQGCLTCQRTGDGLDGEQVDAVFGACGTYMTKDDFSVRAAKFLGLT